MHFQRHYRVLAPTYPRARDLIELSDRLLTALDALGVERFAVVGSSLGGYIAQYLVSTVPDRVRAAVFANTFPPNGEIERNYRLLALIARLAPEGLVRQAFRWQIERILVPAGDHDPFLRYYLTQSAASLEKDELVGRWRALVTRFAPPDPKIPHLVVQSSNDPLVPDTLRKALLATYPRAQRFTFQGGGHFPYLNRPRTYNAMLSDFLSSSGIAESPPLRT